MIMGSYDLMSTNWRKPGGIVQSQSEGLGLYGIITSPRVESVFQFMQLFREREFNLSLPFCSIQAPRRLSDTHHH